MKEPIANLTNMLAEWQSLQPLKREDSDRLWRKLRLDWNYHSNHIEGNTLTYGETEILLIHGQATGDHGLRDYEEMKAHDVAIDHMRHLVDDDRPLTEADIRDFNRILLKESFWKDAITPDGQPSRIEILPGEYKQQTNNVRTASGEIFRFADPAEVPIRMNELVQWLRAALERKELHPVEIASKLHHDFVLIHPFGDGNGRTARLLVNYVLMRNGFLPLIVPTEQKDSYLAALRRADTGELNALTDYLAKCAEASMTRGILAAKGESIEEPDDLAKEVELFKRQHRKPAADIERRDRNNVTQAIRENIVPLFCDLARELQRFDELFHDKKIEGTPYFVAEDIAATLLTQTYLDEAMAHKRLEFMYRLFGFKGISATAFDAECYIYVRFNDFNYHIGSNDGLSAVFGYGERLSDSSRGGIVKEAVRRLFDRIKRESGGE
jgi:Fic family protein